MQSTPPVRATLMLLPHRLPHAFFLGFVVTTIVKIDHKEEKNVVQYFNIIPPCRNF